LVVTISSAGSPARPKPLHRVMPASKAMPPTARSSGMAVSSSPTN